MTKKKLVFLVYSKNLPKKFFGNYPFSAFCFSSKLHFKNFLLHKYGKLTNTILKNLKKVLPVPKYTPNGKVYIFESKDKFGKQILYECTKDGIEFVMMEWEKLYMEACIDYLTPKGDVLEFGFGLGYSASQILKHDIESYTVVERNPVVYKKAVEWSKKYKNKKIEIVFSDWRNYLPDKKFDSFFFDTYDFSNPIDLTNFIQLHSKNNSLFGCPCVTPLGPKEFVHYNFLLKKSERFFCYVPSNAIYVTNLSKIWVVKYEKQLLNNFLKYN